MGVCHSKNGHHPKEISKDKVVTQNQLNTHIDRISPYTKLDDVSKYYTLGSTKGHGSFGVVREAICKQTKQKFAVKTVWKAHYNDKKIYLQKEIEILYNLDHENIIKLYNVYEDNTAIHFVFELIEGGELFDYILSNEGRFLPESRAVDLFYQILCALQYLHSKNIVHRDIKPENFLVFDSAGKIKLKLIDFGFAEQYAPEQKMTDILGSPQYVAPEMTLGEPYDEKVDMWSAGVVLYNMLSGRHPFWGETESELLNNVVSAPVVYSQISFKNPDAKNLCENLINRDPRKRFSASEAITHRWIDNYINTVNCATVGVRFEPKTEEIKIILSLLNKQSTIKYNLYNFLLEHLNLEIIINIKEKFFEYMNEKLKQDQDDTSLQPVIGGRDYIPYQKIIEFILHNFVLRDEVSTFLKGKIKYM
jgi:serine/threonine protein kinase